MVQWLNVIPHPRQTRQESITLERKYSLESSSVISFTRRDSGRETRWLWVDLEELEEMDASEIHAERFNAKEVILPKSGEN